MNESLTKQGMAIIENDRLCFAESYQYRFPKSKRKRIRKKWSKSSKNYKDRLVYPIIIESDSALYCHSVVAYGLTTGKVRVPCRIFKIDKIGVNYFGDPPEFKFDREEINIFKTFSYRSIFRPDNPCILSGVVA